MRVRSRLAIVFNLLERHHTNTGWCKRIKYEVLSQYLQLYQTTLQHVCKKLSVECVMTIFLMNHQRFFVLITLSISGSICQSFMIRCKLQSSFFVSDKDKALGQMI